MLNREEGGNTDNSDGHVKFENLGLVEEFDSCHNIDVATYAISVEWR